MRRQRIEDLVGDDDPDDRRAVVGVEAVGETLRRESIAELVESRRLDLDRPVADNRGEVGRVGRQARENPGCQGPAAGAVLPDREAVRPSERSPRVVDVTRDRPTEDRVGLGRSQEVAAASGSGGRGPVVAVDGVDRARAP